MYFLFQNFDIVLYPLDVEGADDDDEKDDRQQRTEVESKPGHSLCIYNVHRTCGNVELRRSKKFESSPENIARVEG